LKPIQGNPCNSEFLVKHGKPCKVSREKMLSKQGKNVNPNKEKLLLKQAKPCI
jgi:hypothetical protein